MKTYVLLHFERKNDFTVIVKLCMELWDISALACTTDTAYPSVRSKPYSL